MTGKRLRRTRVWLCALLSVLCLVSTFLHFPAAYAAEGEVTALALNSESTDANAAFYLPNLLPGDSATGHYSLSVSYTGTIQVCFAIECRDENAVLAEALNVKVTYGTAGQTLYEGRMGDMPVLSQTLSTAESAKTEQLSYTVTVSLPTSAGNEYQNKQLTADFSWWAEYTPAEDPDGPGGGGLVPPTGDSGRPLLWLLLALAALLVIAAAIWFGRRNQGKARFFSILLVLGLLIGGMSITTAALQYYKQTVEDNFFQTGTVKINLNDNKPIFNSDILVEPGMELHSDFTVRNEGTADCYYRLLLTCQENALARQLEVELRQENKVLFAGTMAQLNGLQLDGDSAFLRAGEQVALTLVLHMPETAGNDLQNQLTLFDVQVQAVQAANNPSRLFD